MRAKVTAIVFIVSAILTILCGMFADSATLIPGIIGMLSALTAGASIWYLMLLEYREAHMIHKRSKKIEW